MPTIYACDKCGMVSRREYGDDIKDISIYFSEGESYSDSNKHYRACETCRTEIAQQMKYANVPSNKVKIEP